MTLFQERLQLLLDEKGIKPVELARATKISPATISKYLSDEGKDPSLSCALKIARYFNVTSEWLYGFSNNRNPFYEPKLIDVYFVNVRKIFIEGNKLANCTKPLKMLNSGNRMNTDFPYVNEILRYWT